MSIVAFRSMSRRLVEEFIYLPRSLCINSRHLGKVRQACPLDCFHSAKMTEQRPLAGGTDPGNFLESRLADVLLAARAMRTDGKSVGLIAQPLDEIKQRVARRQPEGIASGGKECLAAGVAVGALGNGDKRDVGNTE